MLGILFLSIHFAISETEISATENAVANSIQASSQTTLVAYTDYLQLSNTPSEETKIDLYCWLGSKSCYLFETIISDWANSQNIKVNHIPLIKRPSWRRLAKARLVAQTMGVDQQLSMAIYQRLHEQQLAIERDEDLFQVVKQSGIPVSRFSNTFYAAETNQALNAIQTAAENFQVTGIPTVVINNQWLVSAQMQPTSRKMIATISQLLGLQPNG